MRPLHTLFTLTLCIASLLVTSQDAHAGQKSGLDALVEHSEEQAPYNVVQNRFFLKAQRFEVAPVAAYVPNNPMVKRYVGGVLLAYHFSETMAAEGALMYSPDLNESDLKDLTHTLVQIASESETTVKFNQPVDKMILGATFAARWAPVYGKINLIGETILNFDLYGVAGLGMLAINKYYATWDSAAYTSTLGTPTSANEVALNLGIGMDFFLSGMVALKIDARSYFYVDSKPQYNPNVPVDDQRLYNNFMATAGIGVYFPKMKPRMVNF